MTTPRSLTIDDKITNLVREVDEQIRGELYQLLRTLRQTHYAGAVLDLLMRLGLRLTSLLFEAVGERPTTDNLFDRVETARQRGWLPDEMASYLHLIRILGNKLHHGAEGVRIQIADAENVLNAFLRVIEWFYCECRANRQRLATIFFAVPESPRSSATDDGPREHVVGVRFSDAELFMGREEYLAQLRSLLREPAVKLIGVVGRAGIGKTTLISRLCGEIERGDLRLAGATGSMGVDGIMYLTCRGVEKPCLERLVDGFARMLGTPAAQELTACLRDAARSPEEKARFLLSRLMRGRYLIVLDNLEEMLDSENALADVALRAFLDLCLVSSHGVKILATSREPVVVAEAGRRAVRIIVLNTGLTPAEGCALLRELDPDGSLGLQEASEDTLTRLVLRCYGIPRALEAAVGMLARDPTLTPAELLRAEELFRDRFVESLVNEQQRRLGGDERRVLEALAVFESAVPRSAITWLVSQVDPKIDVTGCLRTLVRDHVVIHQRGTDRFDLHPLDREEAYLAIGSGSGDRGRAWWHERAAGFYRQARRPRAEWRTLDDVDPLLSEFRHLIKAGRLEGAAAVAAEVDCAWVAAQGHSRLVVDLRTTLCEQQESGAWAAENSGRLGLALNRLGEAERAKACLERALSLSAEGCERERSEFLGGLGWALCQLGDDHAARSCHEEAVRTSRKSGDRAAQARALKALGIVHHDLGDLDRALDCYEEAMQIAHEGGDRLEAASCLNYLGLGYFDLGRTRRAAKYLSGSLAVCRQHADLMMEGELLDRLGQAYADLGDFARGLAWFEEALVVSRRIGDRRREGRVLDNRGSLLLRMGRVDEALRSCLESLDISRAIGDRYNEAFVRHTLGCCYHHLGQLDQAAAHYAAGVALDLPATRYRCALKLGVLNLERGRLAEARGHLETGLAHCHKLLQSARHSYDAAYHIGLGELAQGDEEATWRSYERALAVCAEPGVIAAALRDIRLVERTAAGSSGVQGIADAVMRRLGGAVEQVTNGIESEDAGPRLKRCDLSQCEAACCYDGAYLRGDEEERIRRTVEEYPDFFRFLPQDYVVDGNWQNRIRGKKTNVRPHHYRSATYPVHFNQTRCVFALEDGRCSLQVLAAQLGEHPWSRKPVACWKQPMHEMPDGLAPPARDPRLDPDHQGENYPGFAMFAQCGRHTEDGEPWELALAPEIEYYERLRRIGKDLQKYPENRIL